MFPGRQIEVLLETYQRIHLGHMLPPCQMQCIPDIPGIVIYDVTSVCASIRDATAAPGLGHLRYYRGSLRRVVKFLVRLFETGSMSAEDLVTMRRHVFVMLIPQLLVSEDVSRA